MTNTSGRTRRAVLAALGTAVTSGCLDGGSLTGNSAGRTTRQGENAPIERVPLGETVQVSSEGTVSVSNAAVRKAVVSTQPTEPVKMQSGMQYVTADVSASGDVDPGPFAVVADGEPASEATASVVVRRQDAETRRVAAPAPAAATETAALTWVRGIPESIAWTLPAAVRDELSDGPTFEVQSATVTDEPTLVVSLTVENTGPESGQFHASIRNVRNDEAAEVVSFEVPAGDVVTYNVHPDLRMWPAGTRSALRIDWGQGGVTEPVGE